MRIVLACLLFSPGPLGAQCVPGSRAQLDRSRPVPAKADVLNAWQRRQSAIRSFHFAWSEQQTQPRGWIANPRYVERERLTAPSLEDRRYVVNKTLAVSRDSMRYSYTLDRRAEGETTGNSEPERSFLVSRFVLVFENTCVVDMDIDYVQDAHHGWIPTGWRVTELLADGSRRLVSTASVSSYVIE